MLDKNTMQNVVRFLFLKGVTLNNVLLAFFCGEVAEKEQ